MLYIKIENGKAVAAQTEYPGNENVSGYETRNDWPTFEAAAQRAAELNVANPGANFLPTDSGPNVYPRYDVIEAPKLGDEVSYSFNGDTYPDGKIVRVSTDDKLRIITTDTGSKYYRRKLSGQWKKQGGTWSLVKGHRNERNPSF